MSTKLPPTLAVLGGVLAAGLLAAVILWPVPTDAPTHRPQPGSGPAQGRPIDRGDRAGDAPLPPGVEPADDGPNAPPSPMPEAFGAPVDPTAMDPAALAQMAQQVSGWLTTLEREALKADGYDWDALRAAAQAIGPVLPQFARALARALEESRSPRAALAGSLVLEAYLERGELDAERRDLLARQAVPLLASTLRDVDTRPEDKHHATRLISRYPGDQARAELGAVLESEEADATTRQYALFGLAEIGTSQETDRLSRLLRNDEDLELARVAGHALARIAQRSEDPVLQDQVRQQVEGRLVQAYAKAVERGQHDLYSNMIGTVARLRGQSPPEYIAGTLLDDKRVPEEAMALALGELVGRKATTTLDALRARRGRLPTAALNASLESAITVLEDMEKPLAPEEPGAK